MEYCNALHYCPGCLAQLVSEGRIVIGDDSPADDLPDEDSEEKEKAD
jgi:hypothetical protein